MKINVFTDGGARGNPGPSAIGVVIKAEDGRKIVSFGEKIGVGTNNIAEYQAVIKALDWIGNNIKKLNPRNSDVKLSFYLDSLLVVSQLNGLFKVKNPALRELLLTVRNIEGAIGVPIYYSHIPRALNSEADFEVNKALGLR